MKILVIFLAINLYYCIDVIVIGAGVSGLKSASLLKSNGHNVKILEARNRIGGRIDSDSSLGYTLDLGAAWIHGITDNPIYELSKTNNIQTISFDYDDVKLHSTTLAKIPKEKEIEAVSEDFESYLHKQRGDDDTKNTPDESLENTLSKYIKEMNIDNYNKTLLDNWAFQEIEIEFGSKVKYLSRNYYDNSDGFDGDDHLTPSGYINIFKPLANDLNIQLNTEVVRIEQVDNKVKIYDKNGQIYLSDKVVITIPLGCLKKNTITFVPDLSIEKKNAIKNMNYGTMNKVIVEFSEMFWDENNIIKIINEPFSYYSWMVNYYNVSKKNILIFLTTDETVESKSIEEIKSEVISILSKVYPGENISIKNLVRTKWGSDPYSYGSYSSFGVGATPKDIEYLSKPEGLIYFAGEHTHKTYQQTVHGAYLSGIEVAKTIDSRFLLISYSLFILLLILF
jgi:monoamine oxidase